MGTDCALLLANLFLFYYDYHYMKNLIRDNQCLAKSFNYTVRYIDDLLTFNTSMCETEITNIYPSELILKRTTESATLLTYLDMTVLYISIMTDFLLHYTIKEIVLVLILYIFLI